MYFSTNTTKKKKKKRRLASVLRAEVTIRKVADAGRYLLLHERSDNPFSHLERGDVCVCGDACVCARARARVEGRREKNLIVEAGIDFRDDDPHLRVGSAHRSNALRSRCVPAPPHTQI